MSFIQRRSQRVQNPLANPAPAGTPDVAVDQTQEVQGTRGLRSRAGAWRASVVAATLLLGSVEAAPDVQPAQVGTWTQPVQGVTGLAKQKQAFTRTARIAQGYFQAAPDVPAVAPPETWTQPVQGQTALRQKATAFARTASFAPLLWQTPEDSDGTQPIPPETWTQPIVGTSALGQRTRAVQRIAAGMGRLWQTPEDVTTEPDTWIQPIQGQTTLQQRSRVRQVQLTQQASLWQTLPEPDGTLPVQPETWTQAVPGQTALAQQARSWARAAGIAQRYLQGTTDAPPAVVEPETWTAPIVGTRGLGTARRAFHARAIQALQAGSRSPDLPIVAVFPDPGDVRLGVVYGPTGADYTGTLIVGGGSSPQIVND